MIRYARGLECQAARLVAEHASAEDLGRLANERGSWIVDEPVAILTRSWGCSSTWNSMSSIAELSRSTRLGRGATTRMVAAADASELDQGNPILVGYRRTGTSNSLGRTATPQSRGERKPRYANMYSLAISMIRPR